MDFQAYQNAFTAHIRDPENNPKPENTDEERMAVYRQGVYRNIFESASACFPVCQETIGEKDWHTIIRRFISTHHARSPIFREIPQALVAFLASDKATPNYIKQLAHYEWVELAVSNMQAEKPVLSKKTDLLNKTPVMTPAHMLLEYNYSVQKISAQFKPQKTNPTYLLVFRKTDFEVRFIELNPVVYALLNLIKEGLTGKQALDLLAEKMQHSTPKSFITFGHDILQDLMAQEAIIGSA